MIGAFGQMLSFNDSDLRFLVETVATERRDYAQIVNLIRHKDDLIEPMLQDCCSRVSDSFVTFFAPSPR
jgi:hypothetical protein